MGRNGAVETVMTRISDDNPPIVIAGWRYHESLTYAIRVETSMPQVPTGIATCVLARQRVIRNRHGPLTQPARLPCWLGPCWLGECRMAPRNCDRAREGPGISSLAPYVSANLAVSLPRVGRVPAAAGFRGTIQVPAPVPTPLANGTHSYEGKQ